jgi:glycosyltransferase involved in cell wall biosynthesis
MVPSEGEKASRPTIVYLGRLVPSKRIADIVEATALLRTELPTVQLWLVGDGTRDYIRRLHDLVARHNLSENVRFWGKVSQAQKCDLLKQAHVFAMTSVREGWGLVILEANAFGTPAVVYDVHGLRDSVRDGETGLVCKTNTPPALAANLRKLLTDHELHARLAHGALEWSRCFTWDKNADDMMRILQDVVRPAK